MSTANDEIEEGEIDEAFWAKEDEVEARRQLLWANAAPLVWGAAPAKPRAGLRVEGDVRWRTEDGAAASALPDEARPATTVAQEPEHKKRKASVVEEGSAASSAAGPEEQKKEHKKQKREKKKEKKAKKERKEQRESESE